MDDGSVSIQAATYIHVLDPLYKIAGYWVFICFAGYPNLTETTGFYAHPHYCVYRSNMLFRLMTI